MPRPSASPPTEGANGSAARGLARHPVVRFVGGFALLLIAFYLLTLTPPYRDVLRGWLRLNARVAGAVLNVLGQGVTVQGTQVSSPAFSIDIHRGCDATEPLALYVAALLAFPARGCRKPLGLLVGAALLLALNQARVVSLFFVGKLWPRAFDLMHGEIWQVLFILLALVLWAWWIVGSLRRAARQCQGAESEKVKG
jgi:exosortase/archaeosortase family protein